MELATPRRSRNRKRKRRAKNKRTDRARLEVIFSKRQKLVIDSNVYNHKNSLVDNMMEANAFWENYAAAHEWQRRHNVTWWRTRCHALEHENNILKEKIRNLIQSNHSQKQHLIQVQNQESNAVEESNIKYEDDSEDDLVFQMNDDMMKFLEQSIRHKIELKQKKESEKKTIEKEQKEDAITLEGGAIWVQERTKGAQLLYGEASSRILAMETALQATNERHVDRAKPQYWPNIPLKL